MRTHIGYGSPNKQDTYAAHGSPLGEDEVRLTKEAYGWAADKPLLRARTRCSSTSARRRERGARGARRSGSSGWPPTAPSTPTPAAELDLVMDGRLPDGWDADVPTFSPDDGRSPPARRRSR